VPFGVVSGVSRRMCVLDEGGYCQRRMGSFGDEFWASLCNQWGLCCVVVCEPMELSFEVVSAVTRGRGVLERGPRALRGREVRVFFVSIMTSFHDVFLEVLLIFVPIYGVKFSTNHSFGV